MCKEKIMTTDEKIRYVDSFEDLPELTDEHFSVLKEYSTDDDAFLRSRCAAFLINFVNEDSMEILLRLCDDEDELVRTESYDSLAVFYYKKVEEKLFSKITSENSGAAYEYALMSWADVSSKLHDNLDEHIAFVHKVLDDNNAVDSEVITCYYALTVLGEDSVKNIIAYLKNEDINIRCSAVNLLGELLNDSNKDIIRKSVEELSATETVPSVISAVSSVIKKCTE